MNRSMIIPALMVLAVACGDDDTTESAIELQFAARAGTLAVQCGETYPGLGATPSDVTINDFRFFISEVQLVDASGAAVPVALEQDGQWQIDDIALLDFETGTNGCDSGNADLNTTVRGTVAVGDYTAVRFTLGVPFARNHANAATAPAPMNLTSMFWNWAGGYKFVRIDGDTPAISGWRFHLGSTMCNEIRTGM